MKKEMCSSAQDYFATLGQLCSVIDHKAVDTLADKLLEVRRDNHQVFVFGNGGSACTSGHWIIELAVTSAGENNKGVRAFALPDNIGTLTALANDYSYEDVFYSPLKTYAQRGDVVIAISGSGNSPNVIKACQWAKSNGIMVVGLTGFDGGKLKEMSDLNIHVPCNNYGILEDLHMSIGHLVGQRLYHAISALGEMS
jgi:D-sedoheptulose 7-phosphate isomerase